MGKKALIAGVTGQNGSYLAELLLDKRYEVHGIVRRVSTFNRQRIEHLLPDLHEKKPNHHKVYLHYGDLTDSSSLYRILRDLRPDEVYHLGAQRYDTSEVQNYFSGLVDECGVWNKALSTTEIGDLYNGGSGQTITQ